MATCRSTNVGFCVLRRGGCSSAPPSSSITSVLFFFNDTATTEIYTLSLHDALPISVKRTGKVFQVGSQGTSAEGWMKAAELITQGKIGKLVWGWGAYNRSNPKGEWNYSIEIGRAHVLNSSH